MNLYIEPRENNYYIAFTEQAQDKRYVLGSNDRPLKFLSVTHVKEYFEGYKFSKVLLLESDDSP